MFHAFDLRFRLPENAPCPDSLMAALATAGCDDATIGLGQPGYIGLMFWRDAPTAEYARASAIRDVERAVPGARLIEGADYVN